MKHHMKECETQFICIKLYAIISVIIFASCFYESFIESIVTPQSLLLYYSVTNTLQLTIARYIALGIFKTKSDVLFLYSYYHNAVSKKAISNTRG